MVRWNAGQLSRPIENLFMEVSAGNVQGCSSITINGSNQAVGTSFETLWEEGGIHAFPTSASVMTVSSDDANDTSAGTGAQTVLIKGLDADYLEIQEVVTLNGTTAVNTANSYLRINDMITATAGTGGVNAGSIFIGTGTVTAGKPANVYGEIYIGDGIAHEGFYTVPANKAFYPFFLELGVQSNKDAQVRIVRTTEAGVSFIGSEYEVANTINIHPQGLVRIPEKQDIDIRAKVASGSSDVKCFLVGILKTES
jgi:hypothetical protein